jgi:hypothetical protein
MDLETLVTHPHGFGIETATTLQRAICRMIDGTPLDDLLDRCSEFERRCIEASIGCEVAALGSPPAIATEVLLLAPVRTFKTILSAALPVRACLTADVSLVRPGQEPPRYSALSTAIDSGRALRGHLDTVKNSPLLKKVFIGDTADSITLRHPSGMPLETKVVAAHRGGYSIHSRWSLGVSFIEAPGWYSTDRIVSLEENRDTALGRLLPGCQIFYEGSPWQAAGLCFDMYSKRFGKPDEDVLVIAPQEVN